MKKKLTENFRQNFVLQPWEVHWWFFGTNRSNRTNAGTSSIIYMLIVIICAGWQTLKVTSQIDSYQCICECSNDKFNRFIAKKKKNHIFLLISLLVVHSSQIHGRYASTINDLHINFMKTCKQKHKMYNKWRRPIHKWNVNLLCSSLFASMSR